MDGDSAAARLQQPSLYRPSFLSVFTNSKRNGGIEPGVSLCVERGRDLHDPFVSPVVVAGAVRRQPSGGRTPGSIEVARR
jgi:hypothetical protein